MQLPASSDWVILQDIVCVVLKSAGVILYDCLSPGNSPESEMCIWWEYPSEQRFKYINNMNKNEEHVWEVIWGLYKHRSLDWDRNWLWALFCCHGFNSLLTIGFNGSKGKHSLKLTFIFYWDRFEARIILMGNRGSTLHLPWSEWDLRSKLPPNLLTHTSYQRSVSHKY